MNNFITCFFFVKANNIVQIFIKYQQRADIHVQCAIFKTYTFRGLKHLKNI